jgi:G:T/U-mismatch repair DNA glycosylase
MISSFPHFINSQTETLILGTIPGVASLMKQRVLHTREIIFWKIMYTLFSSLPISEIYIKFTRGGMFPCIQNIFRKSHRYS